MGINEVQEDSKLWPGFNVPYLKSITTKDLKNRKNTMDLTFQRPIIDIILDKLLNSLELPTIITLKHQNDITLMWSKRYRLQQSCTPNAHMAGSPGNAFFGKLPISNVSNGQARLMMMTQMILNLGAGASVMMDDSW